MLLNIYIKHFFDLAHPLAISVQHLLCISDYAARQIPHLKILLQEDNCQFLLTREDYQHLVESIPLHVVTPVFSRALRHFRHRHLLRLALREVAHLASTEETMSAWSHVADAVILHTLRYAEGQLSQRFGRPYGESGALSELYVLAMGKLGGEELNYSSDIDLICAFSEAGQTDGAESISNQEYFSKVVQLMIQLLQQNTEDGFVFRVDLRLRPNGESGPLVSSLASMETYYQEQGRDWERYAMVKARLIGGEKEWFQRLITPFVYRRYVDFSVIESLRNMKAMIEREIQHNPMLDDIKRGRGGIREVEFIIQSFQLIRGGRLPHIQQKNAMAALHALKKEGLLAHTAALQQAYLFLRKLENAIQLQNDQQLHALPLDTMKQAQLALAMDSDSWKDVLTKLHQYQRIIGRAFHAVLSKVVVYQDEKSQLISQLASLWQGHIEQTMAVNLLTSLHFRQAERCYQMIHTFRHSSRCRRLSQVARMRLDRFMGLLLCELTRVKETDWVLLQVVSLLENIVGRSAYLALLTENPAALQELLHWFSHSPFITSLLVHQPFLLEVLVDQERTWRPLSRIQLKKLLQLRLAHLVEPEQQDDALREFKLTCWLLAARAELYGQCDPLRMGKFLADVAEVIITDVLDRACCHLSLRHPEIMQVKSKFAIIAYGKLGSREMNYDSDVDLVFLHTASPSDEGLVTRLTQKILHMLTTRSQAGVLYSVDTRLRPSGAAGLLVSHLDAFVDYQRHRAWTWEHQSLLRARVVFGSQRVRRAFIRLKKDVLLIPREKQQLHDEILRMREKIDKHIDSNPIKHNPGGLLDLEFLVQFLVLAHANEAYARYTNTFSLLQQLRITHILSAKQFEQLTSAYQQSHRALPQQLLEPNVVVVEAERRDVIAMSQVLMKD